MSARRHSFPFFVNAFYAGDGIMVYGEGMPTNLFLGGQQWNFLAGSLDVVAHELTHGVTDYSSGSSTRTSRAP